MSNTPAASFDIEYNHTDAQIAEFASRCGCPKCERYRATHVEPAPTVRQAIPVMATTPTPAVGSVPPGVPTVTIAAGTGASYCACALGVRGRVESTGACSTCGRLRRPQPAPTPRNVVRDLDAPLSQRSADAVEAAAHTLVAARDAEIAQLKRQLATQRGYIAGAANVAAGKFFGFGGQGSMRRDALLAIIASAGLDADIAPGVKSAHAQAGDAVGKLNGRGYVVRADRARTVRDSNGREIPRTWKARWIVAEQRGSSFPTIGTVALSLEGKLEFAGVNGATFPTQLADGIRADFESMVAGAVYDATDVSSWLRRTMVHAFRGVSVGGNWYVRSKHTTDAERLCNALAKTWGRSWLLPAVPMVASDELSEGIVSSFVADAESLMDTFITERDAKDEHGKVIGIGKRRAAGLLSQVRELIERCAGFASMFGEARTKTVKTKLVAIAEEIQGATDDISTRFSLIFEELARDAK